MLDLQQRRLDGIAGELAGRLADGESCLVCGSTEHPSPATPHRDAVSAEEQSAASEAHELAQQAHAELVGRVADAQGRAASLRELSAGKDAGFWTGEVGRLTSELEAATRAGDRVTVLEAEVHDLELQLAEADDHRRFLDVRRAELAEALRAGTARLLDAEAAVAAAAGQDEVDTTGDLSALGADARADLEAAEHADQAVRLHADRAARVAEVEQQALDTAFDHGFVDPEEVRSAALPPDEARLLEHQVGERKTAIAAALAVLAEPDIAGAEAPPELSLAELQDRATAAEVAAQEAARRHHLAEQRHAALRMLSARLDAALEAWAPARDDHVLAESMSRLVRGMGSDNQLQMRLSAYVLATPARPGARGRQRTPLAAARPALPAPAHRPGHPARRPGRPRAGGPRPVDR